MYISSSIWRSKLIEKDFELLLQSRVLNEIIDDGFATEQDYARGEFKQKKALLATRL